MIFEFFFWKLEIVNPGRGEWFYPDFFLCNFTVARIVVFTVFIFYWEMRENHQIFKFQYFPKIKFNLSIHKALVPETPPQNITIYFADGISTPEILLNNPIQNLNFKAWHLKQKRWKISLTKIFGILKIMRWSRTK